MEANTAVQQVCQKRKKISARNQPPLLNQNCVHGDIKSGLVRKRLPPSGLQIFCLPLLLDKNIKIKLHNTIILPVLSMVNPDLETRSCGQIQIPYFYLSPSPSYK
jgi:hypothetical protein